MGGICHFLFCFKIVHKITFRLGFCGSVSVRWAILPILPQTDKISYRLNSTPPLELPNLSKFNGNPQTLVDSPIQLKFTFVFFTKCFHMRKCWWMLFPVSSDLGDPIQGVGCHLILQHSIQINTTKFKTNKGKEDSPPMDCNTRNTKQCHTIPCNIIQYHAISYNTM